MSDLTELIDAAKADAPPADAQERGWSDLSAAIAVGQAPVLDVSAAETLADALAAGASQSGMGALAKIVIVAAVAGAIGVGVVATQADPGPPTRARAVAPLPQPSARDAGRERTPQVEPRPDPPPVAEPSDPVAEPEPEAEPTDAKRPRRRRPSGEPPETQQNFVEETRLLTRAWAAIRAGEYQRAISLTAEHRRRFPKGTLAQEREASRTVALCHLESGRASGRALRRFVKAHPGSVHEARVESACEASDPE